MVSDNTSYQNATNLRAEYDAACRLALERYRPGQKPADWLEACQTAARLWKELQRARAAER